MREVKVPFGGTTKTIYAGPYTDKPEGMFGIKMAAEINKPRDVSIPVRDFCVPGKNETYMVYGGLLMALWRLSRGQKVYVGCKGGIGRTGLFLALLFKALGANDPVKAVRAAFIPHAVETPEQQDYIAAFDVGPLKWAVLGFKLRARLPEVAD